MREKFMSVILLHIIVISLLTGLTGCLDNGANISSDNDISESLPGEDLIEPESLRLQPDLPDITYDGAEIAILGTSEKYGGGYYKTTDVYAEEMNGEPLNDAIYARNRNIEERFDIIIVYDDSDDVYSAVMKSVSAGDYTCDITFGSWNNMVNLALGKFLIDISKLEYVDLTKPWWDENAINRTAVAKRVYYATGELSTLDNSCTRMVYFNKKLIDDFSLDIPYTLVNDNDWTLDNYINMAGSVYSDLNGDGISNEGDLFGTFREGGYYDFLFVGCDMDYVKLDGDGRPVITFLQDHTFTLTDKIFDFLYDDKACFNISNIKDLRGFPSVYTYARNLFVQDLLLFTIGGPLVIGEFRNMESDFGIVPLPKYDALQERYCTYVDAGTNMIGVPLTAADEDRTGIIMESMAADSMYVITPVYNEILLKRKYSRDNESEAMLDLINGSRVFNLKNAFDIGGIKSVLDNAYSQNKYPLASDYEAVAAASEKKLDELYTVYSE